jgi:hypothetical protein
MARLAHGILKCQLSAREARFSRAAPGRAKLFLGAAHVPPTRRAGVPVAKSRLLNRLLAAVMVAGVSPAVHSGPPGRCRGSKCRSPCGPLSEHLHARRIAYNDEPSRLQSAIVAEGNQTELDHSAAEPPGGLRGGRESHAPPRRWNSASGDDHGPAERAMKLYRAVESSILRVNRPKLKRITPGAYDRP